MRSPRVLAVVLGATPCMGRFQAAPAEFLDEAKQLIIVGACAKGESRRSSRDVVAEHCKKVTAEPGGVEEVVARRRRPFFKSPRAGATITEGSCLPFRRW